MSSQVSLLMSVMVIFQRFKGLLARITADSVSCGTLALWAAAMGLLVILMQIYSHRQLLSLP
jgi:hypothetical protein